MIDQIRETPFNRASFIELTKNYHDKVCTTGEACLIFENDYKKKFTNIKFSVYGGFQILSLEFYKNILPIESLPLESMKSLYPVIGGQMNISNPRWSKWVSFQVDLSLSALKGDKDYTNGDYFYGRYKLDGMSSSGKVNLKYTMPLSGKLRPTIQGGFSSLFLFNMSSSLSSERRLAGNVVSKEQKDYQEILPKSLYYGFNAAVGLDYSLKNDHSIFGLISYEKHGGSSRIEVLQLKLGYTF